MKWNYDTKMNRETEIINFVKTMEKIIEDWKNKNR
jgi:hypothetical protein